jgi:putative two-component system response regulator
VILNLGRAIEARDPYTEGHCERLAGYAAEMGAELQLSPAEMQVLYRGALLHDIGKIVVPDAILLKPGRLTADEFEVVKRHTTVGEMLCADFRALRLVRPIVRHHHERLDGSGYPDGLKGDAIPLLAQIIGIVDVFDALTTSRSYKPALSFPAAAEVLCEEATRGLHERALVDVLMTLYKGGAVEPAPRQTPHPPHLLGGVLP